MRFLISRKILVLTVVTGLGVGGVAVTHNAFATNQQSQGASFGSSEGYGGQSYDGGNQGNQKCVGNSAARKC